MTPPPSFPPPEQDAMPTTKGLNFFLEDRSFQLLCEQVMGPEVFARARTALCRAAELGSLHGMPGIGRAARAALSALR